MSEQPSPEPAFHALTVVLRDYLSYGQNGMEDLKETVHARRRPPVIEAFCNEIQQILSGQAAVPTALINQEFQRRAREEVSQDGEGSKAPDEDDVIQYTDQQAYEAIADLWEYLDLSAEGKVEHRTAAMRQAAVAKAKTNWIEGDPVATFKSWASWKHIGLAVAGVLICMISWTIYTHIGNGFLRALLLPITIVSFCCGAYGAVMLWLSRLRYVNPQALLPRSSRPKKGRR
ncbi:hypothetical protein BIV57_02130 [Mangrovactinospora gilvigrisea]|uniref:Uncharacterized protein n=1 Tax=Mangrovactinospora gilvigrisea TaxID=1428644 RepID=A0A1J7BKI4_9ACTN|nr:hypothetical protein [Mangrovactinospora gilvigrisea]OIV39150.1 hypothetical protein BIV57_02130 [Mangrovactinospora gilvigrisea]